MKRLCDYGIPLLDKNLTGMMGGDLVVVGAMSGTGKTTLANSLAMSASSQGISTALFSLENAAGDWKRQMVFTEFKQWVPNQMSYREFLNVYSSNPSLFERYEEKVNQILSQEREGVPLFYLVESTDGIKDLKTLLERVKACIDAGKQVIVIDHIDHVSNDARADLQFIRTAMKELAELAFNRDVCIITFSQIRKDLPPGVMCPGMYDLKGGSPKTDVASVVITMARDPFFDDPEQGKFATLMAIRKDRYGKLAMGRLFWKNGTYEQDYKQIESFDANGYIVDGLSKDKLALAAKQIGLKNV